MTTKTRKSQKPKLAALLKKPDLNGLEVARLWMENDLHFEEKGKLLYAWEDLMKLVEKLREGPPNEYGVIQEEARLNAIMGAYDRAKVNLKNFNILYFAFGGDTFRLMADLKAHGARLVAQLAKPDPLAEDPAFKGLKEWLESGKDLEEELEEIYDSRIEDYKTMKAYLEVFKEFKNGFGISHFFDKAGRLWKDVERHREEFTREADFVLANFPSVRELDKRTNYLTASKLENVPPRGTESFRKEKELIKTLAEI